MKKIREILANLVASYVFVSDIKVLVRLVGEITNLVSVLSTLNGETFFHHSLCFSSMLNYGICFA